MDKEDLKSKNDDLTNEIKDLKKRLMIENTKNNILFVERLKEENELEKKLKEIEENKNSLNLDKEEIISNKKKYDLYELSLKPLINFSEKEELISVIFNSLDQKIHYSVICKNTDKFNKLEEKLYLAYPQFSETDNFFTLNGKIINKFKSLEENNIKDNDVIIINKKEE